MATLAVFLTAFYGAAAVAPRVICIVEVASLKTANEMAVAMDIYGFKLGMRSSSFFSLGRIVWGRVGREHAGLFRRLHIWHRFHCYSLSGEDPSIELHSYQELQGRRSQYGAR